MSVASHIAFWILTEVVTTLFGCYMAGTMWNCCHLGASSVYNHTSMHQFTMSLYLKPHTQDACVFSCNLPPALLAEWLGSFPCYCGNTGVEWILKQVSTESWRWRGPATFCRDQTWDPSITSLSPYHWAIPTLHIAVWRCQSLHTHSTLSCWKPFTQSPFFCAECVDIYKNKYIFSSLQ